MKTIGIKKLLTWAFAEELPKVNESGRFGPGVSLRCALADIGTLGTLIDRSPNAWGVIPVDGDGEPHADALTVGQAVQDLGNQGFDIPEGWWPFPDWDDPRGLIRIEVERAMKIERLRGDRLSGRRVVSLVVSRALLGVGPDWQGDAPATLPVLGANGKAQWFVQRRARDRSSGKMEMIEDNGYDIKAHRPKKGAYQKYRLAHPIMADIHARLDWQLWQSALETLQITLDGRLNTWALSPFRPWRAPWCSRAVLNKSL